MKITKIFKSVKKFWKENTRGGVTVFICLVLIPVMMFTGLMIDISRIKLYHSEAAGTANSYADAVLSQYDEMLYDVYGLLAITQDEEGLKALDVIKEYMQSAYDPSSTGKATNASQSELNYIPANIVFIGQNNDKLNTSWAPYGNTKMKLDKVIDNSGSGGANLSNNTVFANQVCDYMKIIGPVDLVWNGLTDAIDSGDKTKENAELMNDRKEVDKEYGKLDDKLKELYKAAKALHDQDVWSIPNEAVSFVSGDNNIAARYNLMYQNYVSLSDGEYGKIGQLYGNAVSALRNDEDGGLYDTWVSEIQSGSVGSGNYLYELLCIRAAISADSSRDLENAKYKNPQTGTTYNLGNIRYRYDGPNRAFKKYIAEYRNEINKKFDDLDKKLSDGDIPKELDKIASVLGGGTNFFGGTTDGINTIASNAENKRANLVDKCKSKEGTPDAGGNYSNAMAHGMAEEYSFTQEGSEEMKFVGDFDYNWLKSKYENNSVFIEKLKEYLESERIYLISKLDAMENDIFGDGESLAYLTGYFDSKLADLEKYSDGEITGLFNWNYSSHGESSEISRNNLIFTNIDDVKRKLAASPNPAEWFDMTDAALSLSEQTTNNRDFKKLWQTLEKWYKPGGTSEQSDAKTTEFKNLLKELKDSLTNRGDAGKELLEQFENVNIPDFINTPDTGDQSDQSVASLFGDEGDFTTTIKSDGTERNTDYYITKLLMMDYDWNFFTGATFGKSGDGGSEKNKLKGKTLKGEDITADTNYLLKEIEGDLCGAELEYIYWGNKNAKKNLAAVRNQIMVIRAVENFASTYSIDEINTAINAIKTALASIPIAALIVPPLIRAAIAMAETYMDLQALYEGKSIVLYKTKIGHLTLLSDESLKNSLNKMFTAGGKNSPFPSGGSDSDKPIKFNYSQYVILVTALFCDTNTIVERTQDLVELNINHRMKVNIPEAKRENLKFSLSKASVAVSTTCKIDRMNLFILGGIFNRESADDYLSEEKTDLLKDGFSYTVYKSY